MAPAAAPTTPAAPPSAPSAAPRPVPQMKKKTYVRSAMATLMPSASLAPALPTVLEEFESYTAEISAPGTDILQFWAVCQIHSVIIVF
jgi:hypothetical protein